MESTVECQGSAIGDLGCMVQILDIIVYSGPYAPVYPRVPRDEETPHIGHI